MATAPGKPEERALPHLPDVILLNGTSSSGKTSLARALQASLPSLYLNFSIDSVLYALPPEDLDAMIAGRRILRPGYRYADLVYGFHGALAGLLATGNRLVVDNAMTTPEWRADFDRAVAPYRALRVGVICDLATTAAREAARGDRAPGTAERAHPLVHAGMGYDLTVDTSSTSAEAAAIEICRFIAAGA